MQKILISEIEQVAWESGFINVIDCSNTYSFSSFMPVSLKILFLSCEFVYSTRVWQARDMRNFDVAVGTSFLKLPVTNRLYVD